MLTIFIKAYRDNAVVNIKPIYLGYYIYPADLRNPIIWSEVTNPHSPALMLWWLSYRFYKIEAG